MNHAAGQHLSVLLDASVQALQLKPAGTYVDATFGRGGHTRAMLERLGRAARVVAFDKDPQAIEAAHAIVDARFSIVHAGFVDLAPELAARGIDAVDGVLFDLGVSSPQLDDPTRGFSFRQDGPLDMRMDTTRGMSAAEFVATATQGELARVIRDYGEERFAVSVAKAIVARRSTEPITRTGDLAALVARAVRTREPNQDPATRTFQALRIHINRELEELPLALESALRLLVPGGRLAVIAFHSLEDRIVKRFMHARSRVPEAMARLPLRESQLPAPLLTEIERVLPDAAEIARNPRARSAVLRSATRTAAAYRATEAT